MRFGKLPALGIDGRKKNNNNNDTQCQNKEEKWQQTKNNTPYAKQFVLFAVLRCYRCFISCHLFSWKCSTKQIGCNQRKSKQNVSLISKADSFYPSLSLFRSLPFYLLCLSFWFRLRNWSLPLFSVLRYFSCCF